MRTLVLLLLLVISWPGAARAAWLAFAGDVIFGEYEEQPDGRPWTYHAFGAEDDDPFAEVRDLLDADLSVVNLETPLIERMPVESPVGTRHRFGASAAQGAKLARGGIGAVSLANNHALDLRGAGAVQTPAILRRLGVVPLGEAGPGARVETVERGGVRIGFLSVTCVRNVSPRAGEPAPPVFSASTLAAQVAPLLREARPRHHLLVVLVHWGREYSDGPTESQRRAAHRLIEAGADLVIGHHPHVLHGLERYRGGLIAYSLGNFLFPNANAVPRLSGVLRVRAEPQDDRAALIEARFAPVAIGGHPRHPRPARGRSGSEVRARVRDLSLQLGTTLEEDGDDLRVPLSGGVAPAS